MSSYVDYEDAPVRRRKSERNRRPRDREYVEEETYVRRGGGNGQMSLVQRRRDDSVSSVEEVTRDFPPGSGGYVRRKNTVREGARRARSADRGYDDSYYRSSRGSDYERKSRRGIDDKSSRKSRRYSSSSSSPEPRHRRKSMGEQALAALGLGGAAAALTGKKSKSRSRSRDGGRSRSRRRHDSSSRSRSRGGDTNAKVGQALKAAITAGAVEAFRARKDPGGWGGEKGKRILTAAIGAGGVDGLIDRDPDKHSKRHILESALAGLAANRVVNGPRSQSRGRARSESRGRGGDGHGGGLGQLAAAGGVAALGKAAYDRMRSKSRARGRGRRSSSESSYDSHSPVRRKRSKSVSDYVNSGLAAVGLKEAADKGDNRRRRDYEDDYSYRSGPPRGGGSSRDVGYPDPSVANPKGKNRKPRDASSSSSTDSDLPSSSDEERQRKKMRGKELITAGLASVATIHAAHSVYQSVEKRNERKKQLAEGEISKEEAKKQQNAARFKDVASVGIAALGIKSAVTEWKEMKETRKETKEFKEKQMEHHERRLRRERRARDEGRDSRRNNSEPNLHSPYYGGPSTYYDDNPYSAGGIPPPPPGPPPPGYVPGYRY